MKNRSFSSATRPQTAAWRAGVHGLILALAAVFGLAASLTAQAQRQATATATVVKGFVVAITVTDGGAGYPKAPAVTISGGGGSGATAQAVVAAGAVERIQVTSAGVGYTAPPEVMIASPPPPQAPVLQGVQLMSALSIEGTVGTTNWVLYAETLAPWNWRVLTNLVVASSPYVVVDPAASPLRRFYRVVAGATPPVLPTFSPDSRAWTYIQPGTFTMGSLASEQDRAQNEGPQTTVVLTHEFFLGTYEVTQAEYLAVMGSNPSYFKGDLNRPVESVTWLEAAAYCAQLTTQERAAGRLPLRWGYRLPTEAEWEYATRAGTRTRFSWGDDPGYALLGTNEWYVSNSGSQAHPVGLKQANPWGLRDMNGNVAEWCGDWYGPFPGGSVTDPASPGFGSARVIRGGSYLNVGWICRSAFRLYLVPSDRRSNVGFRVVLVPGQP